MRIRAAASLLLIAATGATAATLTTVPAASAAVWDDDAGLVFFGRGYAEPTPYGDAFNALEGRTLTTIGGGSGHVCAVDETGEAVCWGASDRGRHGTGARSYPPEGPAAVSTAGALADKTLIDIDTGDAHSCAVDDAGQAYCWGSNSKGQLGRDVGTAFAPVAVVQRMLPEGASFVDITTAGNHTCALTEQGEAYCWGENRWGQLGTGNEQDADRPERVRAGDTGGRRLVAIDAGAWHTCAVDAGGRAYCWGENFDGKLGTGNTRQQLTPTRVVGTGPNGITVAEISAGGTQTCAATDRRRPFCWGSNTFHQVSPSDRGSFYEPHRIDTRQVSEISAGFWHTCSVVEATDIYCWGHNRSGQIGNGTKSRWVKEPTLIDSPGVGLDNTEPERVQALYDKTCAMDAAGVAYCWGAGGAWHVGLRVLSPKPVPAEPTAFEGGTLTDLTDAGFSWCGMTSPAQPVCWSEGPFGASSYNRLRGVFRDVPTDDMTGGPPLTSLEAGTELGCVLDADGLAYCWGSGPLGIEGTYYSRAPVPVDTTGAFAGKTLVDITAGESHACAVDDNGKAYCWGEDNFGEVGNGQAGSTQVPVAVKDSGVLAGKVLVEIEAGQFNTCALSDDGEVFCWGGWLGDGSGTTSQKPVRTDLSRIPGGETPASLHVAWDTPCLITDAGHAYCWGSSYQGQTGTGKVTGSVLRPTAVVSDGVLTGVELTELVMPENTSMCGLSTAGRVYCWGEDRYGVLGNGDFDGRSSVPVAVVNDGVLDGAVVTDLGASTSAVWAVVEQAP